MTDCGLFDEADPLLAELLETTSSPTDELLWAALDGGGGAAEQRPEPGLGLASADAGGGAGLVAAAPAAPGTWRCLDATHAASCEHGCTPAPDGSAAEAAALVGDRGKRNGEKLLRALLLRSPEWHSAGARDAAASDPACGGAHPAAALNRKRATGLRKAELLALLHLWRYKSCIWAPRAGPAAAAAVAARRSRPPRGLQPQQPQQQLLQLPRPVEAPQLHYLAATLGGARARAAAVAAASASPGRLHLSPAHCAALRRRLRLARRAWAAAAAVHAEAAALRWRCCCGGGGAADAAASAADGDGDGAAAAAAAAAAALARARRGVGLLLTALSGLARGLAMGADAAPAPDAAAAPAAAAWLAEQRDGFAAVAAAVEAQLAALARRLEAADGAGAAPGGCASGGDDGGPAAVAAADADVADALADAALFVVTLLGVICGALHARLLWIDSLVSAWGAALPLDTERVAMPNPSNVCALAKMVSELKLHLADPAAAAAAAGSGA